MIYILHISDLHFNKTATSYNTEEILRREAKEKLQNIPSKQKLLIVTGDFHNFCEDDYIKAEVFLRGLSEDAGLTMSEDIFVIPGNHDVGNDNALQHFLENEDSKWKKHKKAYVHMLKSGDTSFIEDRLSAFRPYNAFVQRLGIYDSALGSDYPSQTHIRNWRGKLNILHLNTALIADGTRKKQQIADTNSAANPKTWEGFDTEHNPSVAIGHNSFYDLKPICRKELATIFFSKNVSAYMSGDRHRTENNPEKQMIRLTSGHRGGIEIPNLVAAKSIADRKDKYSEIGFCWHEWDEETDQVKVEFRKWTPDNLAETVPAGNPGEYVMRRSKHSIPSNKGTNDGPILSQQGLYYLPYGCIGRDIRVKELEKVVSENTCPVVIRGVAGVGKTALCSYYYEKRISDNNKFSMPFISLENSVSKADFIHSVCEALHVKEAYMDLDSILEYICCVERHYDAFFFDNWEDFQSNNLGSSDFQCVCGFINSLVFKGFEILISSQEQPPTGWHEFSIDVLDPDDGRKLFVVLLNRRGKKVRNLSQSENKALDDLLIHMDNHPLTMVLTSSLIEGSNDTLERIQNQWSLVCDKSECKRHRSMEIALKMSYDAILNTPGAESLWGLISALSVDFPVYYIKILQQVDPEIRWDDARRVLSKRSLIQFTEDATHLHMLIPVKAQWEHFVGNTKKRECMKVWSTIIEKIAIQLDTIEFRQNPQISNVIRGDVLECMRSFMSITEYLVNEGEYASAEKCIISMVDYYEPLSDSAFEFLKKLPLDRFKMVTKGIVNKCKGDICRLARREEPKIADGYYQDALSCFEECNEDELCAQVMNVIGKNEFWNCHDVPKALDWQKKSEKKSQDVLYTRGLAEAKKDQAIILTEEYNLYEEAYKYLDISYSLFNELGDYLGIAHCLKRQGVIMWKSGNTSGALDKFNKALEYYESAHYIQGQADTLWRLLTGYMYSDDREKVQHTLSLSELIMDKIPYQMTKNELLNILKKCKDWLEGRC